MLNFHRLLTVPDIGQRQFDEMAVLFAIIFDKFFRMGEQKLTIVPKTLHHYTTPEGFKGIVEEGFRATHIGCMSDGSEFIHALQRLQSEIDGWIPNTEGSARYILERINSELSETQLDHYPSMYLTCFTKHEDSLLHWKNYGKEDGGFCVSFNSHPFVEHIQSFSRFLIAPVLYSRTAQEAIMEFIAKWIVENYPKHLGMRGDRDAGQYTTDWLFALANFSTLTAALLKASAFETEDEWRLIVTVVNPSIVQYRPTANSLTAYTQVPFNVDGNMKLPIRSVWAGPGRYQDRNRVAAMSILKKHGYDFPVRPSPHRF